MTVELIDADGDAAVVGELGTGASTILFIIDLAIIIAISRMGHVLLGQLLFVEDAVTGRPRVLSVWIVPPWFPRHCSPLSEVALP